MTCHRPDCRPVCRDQVPQLDGGWTCRALLESGILRPHTTPQPVAEGRWHLPTALALIDRGHCACRNCNGRLANSDYPSWRRCTECRCAWRADPISGRRYAVMVSGPCRVGALEMAGKP